MMSEDIHKWSDGRYTLMFDEHTFFVWNNEKEERMTALEVTKKLNEQQATITHLEKVNGKNFAKRRLLEQDNLVLRNENEQLRQELEKLKLLNESLGLFMNE
jgi:hypothetical protein